MPRKAQLGYQVLQYALQKKSQFSECHASVMGVTLLFSVRSVVHKIIIGVLLVSLKAYSVPKYDAMFDDTLAP